MSDVGFLTARVWLDDDGEHIWLLHECIDGEQITMLPHPPWRAVGERVEPSISCDKCNLHMFGYLGPLPTDQQLNAAGYERLPGID